MLTTQCVFVVALYYMQYHIQHSLNTEKTISPVRPNTPPYCVRVHPSSTLCFTYAVATQGKVDVSKMKPGQGGMSPLRPVGPCLPIFPSSHLHTLWWFPPLYLASCSILWRRRCRTSSCTTCYPPPSLFSFSFSLSLSLSL